MKVKKFSRNFSKESKEFDDKMRLNAKVEIPSSRSQNFLKLYNASKEGSGWCKPFVGGNALKYLPLYKGNDIILFHNKSFKRGHALKERTKSIDEDSPYEESYKVTKPRHSEWEQATCQT